VTLNFNNNLSTVAVFLDTEKALHTTLYHDLLYELSEFLFSLTLIKLISSFISNRKFRVMAEGELPKPQDIQGEVPQGSVLSPTLYNLFIHDTPQAPGVYLALFADDIYIYNRLQRES
jgi:hypothetical protein